MDIKQYEQNIINKINNGEIIFNREEQIVILNKEELLKKLFYAIGNKVVPCTIEIANTYFPSILESINLDEVPNDILSSTCYQYLECLLNNGYYSFGSIEFFESINVNRETLDKMSKLIENKLNDRNIVFAKADYSSSTIESLLDHKRYEEIKKYKIEHNINLYVTEHIYNRILSEWPYKEKPQIIINYEKTNNIYNYSINQSFDELFNDFKKYNNSKYKIIPTIIEKMKASKDLNELTSNYEIMRFITDNGSRKDEIGKILFDRNCLKYASILLRKNKITQEEYDQKVKYCYDNNLDLPDDILEKFENKNDEKFIKYLINTCKIDLLKKIQQDNYFYNNIDEDLLKKNESYIAEQIKNDNPYYELLKKNNIYNIKEYPLIIRAIIEKGELDYLDLSKIDVSLISIDELLDMIEKNPKIHIMNCSSEKEFISNVTKKLFSEKKYDSIIGKGLLSADFIDNNIELIIEHLDNLVFANYMTYNSLDIIKNVKQKQKIFNKLLSNELFIEPTIDLIIHNEELDSLYNDETYEIIKDYYIKKNNLNPEHLNIVEKTFGPKIIRYLSNENLKNIINLDEETFNKILGLFPITEYTMKDLEAGFESLIQYLYGRVKAEDITIFPTLIHAMEDKKVDEINKIKEKLIIYTKPEFIKRICDKHDLTGIKTTDDLLNLIIQKYDSLEKEKYTNILYELTNDFILTSREKYRNNHYFESQFKFYANYMEQILEAIDTNDEQKQSILTATVAAKLDDNFFKQFSMGNVLRDDFNKIDLMNFLVDKIKNPNTRNQYIPILKETVDYFYKVERNKHSKEISLGKELSLPYSLDEKSKINEGIRYIIENCDTLYDQEMHSILDIISEQLYEQGIDRSLVVDCINYYSGKKNCKNDLSLVQKNMPIVIRTATDFLYKNDVYTRSDKMLDLQELVKKLDKENKIKRIYTLDNTIDSYPVLLNLNIELLKNGLFKNEELYNTLVILMSKRKLHLLPENLKELFDECGITSDYSDIASFINFFGPILESERKKLEAAGKDPNQALSGLASIMINAETYSSISDVYSQILGEKDAKLIKSNPKPNSAIKKINGNQRLIEAVKLTIENYRRQEVTVPAFDTNVSFISDANDEKKLNVIVGNFTDPSNLTHGERTGACMRIGGVGETLFNFCLSNPNGFHIRFEDSETHEYISRVSGFRNGNTVFLNELRYSCDKNKYSDLDVVKACKETAKLLIEYSKESEYPIDNVVISNQYAMAVTKENEVYLNINNNKEGLPSFYSDVGNSAIVLATTAKEEKYTPVNFDKTNMPMYKPCRAKPLILTSEKDLIGRINRVASIKTVLSGISYEDIGRMEFEEGLICGVVSDDWYIYVDKQKNIHYDYIDIDERAKVEIQHYLEVIDEIIKNAEKEKEETESDVYGLR